MVSSLKFLVEGIGLTLVGFLGLVGNTACIFWFSRKVVQRNFYQLMIALAFCDLLFVFLSLVMFGIPNIFPSFQSLSIHLHSVPILLPLAQISLTGSIYFTVAIAVERYTTVCHPFFKVSHNWPARCYILPIATFALAYNLPKFFELRVESVASCSVSPAGGNLSGNYTREIPQLMASKPHLQLPEMSGDDVVWRKIQTSNQFSPNNNDNNMNMVFQPTRDGSLVVVETDVMAEAMEGIATPRHPVQGDNRLEGTELTQPGSAGIGELRRSQLNQPDRTGPNQLDGSRLNQLDSAELRQLEITGLDQLDGTGFDQQLESTDIKQLENTELKQLESKEVNKQNRMGPIELESIGLHHEEPADAGLEARGSERLIRERSAGLADGDILTLVQERRASLADGDILTLVQERRAGLQQRRGSAGLLQERPTGLFEEGTTGLYHAEGESLVKQRNTDAGLLGMEEENSGQEQTENYVETDSLTIDNYEDPKGQICPTQLRKNPEYIQYYLIYSNMIVNGILPLIFLIFLNISCYCQIRKLQMPDASRGTTASVQKKEINLAKVSLIIVAVFIVCHSVKWIPNTFEFAASSSKDDVWPDWIANIASFSHLLVVLNSSVNFYIYYFKYRTRKREESQREQTQYTQHVGMEENPYSHIVLGETVRLITTEQATTTV